ncbi:MAG: RNA polymerase sigma factor [Gemmatimonadales bacterium]
MEDATVRQAFAAHSASLYRYATRMTGDPDLAEDLVQETFVRYAGERSDVHNERAWLFRVISNLTITKQRSLGRRLKLLRSAAHRQPLGDPVAMPDERYEKAELRSLVREALGRLSERDRTLLLMREEGFTHTEIANAINSTTKSVGTLLARALRKVATHLEEVQEALT